MSLAFVFPGQGSQSIGMLSALAAAEPVVEETFAEASRVLGYDLWALCQNGPDAELGSTEKTQPAMLAAGVAVWRVWLQHGGPRPVAMAGHSLGEYTALVCSGSIDFATAVDLVRYRGQVMQQAVPLGQGLRIGLLNQLLNDLYLDIVFKVPFQDIPWDLSGSETFDLSFTIQLPIKRIDLFDHLILRDLHIYLLFDWAFPLRLLAFYVLPLPKVIV